MMIAWKDKMTKKELQNCLSRANLQLNAAANYEAQAEAEFARITAELAELQIRINRAAYINVAVGVILGGICATLVTRLFFC